MDLADGRCAVDVIDETPDRHLPGEYEPLFTFPEIAEMVGFPTPAAAEIAFKRALLKFVANAKKMGFHDLVDAFTGAGHPSSLLKARGDVAA